MTSVHRWMLIPALFVVPALACEKRNLTEVAVPDEGIQLGYDLSEGRRFDGHIRVSTMVNSPLGEIYNAVEYDAALLAGAQDDGRFLVRATLTNVAVNSRLPDGMPAQARLSAAAAKAAEGMELRFFVDRTGDVTDLPEPPADAPTDLKALVALLSTGLQSSFIRLPDGPVRAGDTWQTSPSQQPKGGTATGTGKLLGMARDETTGEEVARLEYTSNSELAAEAENIPLAGTLTGTATALFARTGYAPNVQRRLRGEAAGMSVTLEVSATWKK